MKNPLPFDPLYIVLALVIAGFGYSTYQLNETAVKLGLTTQELASTTTALEERQVAMSDELYAATQGWQAIQSRLGGFENSLGTLEKLSKTDPELLQKYSKVFFLNEHYAPERLSQIEKEFTYDESRPERIHSSVLPYLEDMLSDAQKAGVEIFVKSSYRSFEEQSKLKSAYSVTYGAGSANTFSADQGYSEHQLGTTVDLISKGQGGELAGFEKTAAYAWLQKNAYKYGFVLSYPPNNAHYVFEPWHWRFVGEELADYLHDREKYLYELEQRQIDEFLATLFD
ncbi:M15 family metallopeptidase [Candidatus Nomurabacteria bacterium]|nr:M15 family metallopeptidase [Candidatus Nomurabacteria bacterium]